MHSPVNGNCVVQHWQVHLGKVDHVKMNLVACQQLYAASRPPVCLLFGRTLPTMIATFSSESSKSVLLLVSIAQIKRNRQRSARQFKQLLVYFCAARGQTLIVEPLTQDDRASNRSGLVVSSPSGWQGCLLLLVNAAGSGTAVGWADWSPVDVTAVSTGAGAIPVAHQPGCQYFRQGTGPGYGRCSNQLAGQYPNPSSPG